MIHFRIIGGEQITKQVTRLERLRNFDALTPMTAEIRQLILKHIHAVITDLKWGNLKVTHASRKVRGKIRRVPVDGLFYDTGKFYRGWESSNVLLTRNSVVLSIINSAAYSDKMLEYSKKYIPGGKSILEEAVDRAWPEIDSTMEKYRDIIEGMI